MLFQWTGCEAADLQNSYLTYPHSGILGNNLLSGSSYSSADDCKLACSQNEGVRDWCRTFELSAVSSWCNYHAVTPREVPDQWQTTPYYDLYQRTCA